METLFVGQNAIFLPEVESTNSYAIALLKNVNLPEGTVVYTTNQTKGRGQRGNNWISGPGLNLAASYILKPTFLDVGKIFFMYVVSALAVHDLMSETLNSSQFDIKIKWPNDILVNSKKIAGILNENIISNSTANTTIIGIGININQENFNGIENATSLRLLSTVSYDIDAILRSLSSKLEKYYLQLKNKQFETLLELYYKHFYKMGEQQSFIINGQTKTLFIKGINEKGLLHLADEKEQYHFDIKEIKWV